MKDLHVHFILVLPRIPDREYEAPRVGSHLPRSIIWAYSLEHTIWPLSAQRIGKNEVEKGFRGFFQIKKMGRFDASSFLPGQKRCGVYVSELHSSIYHCDKVKSCVVLEGLSEPSFFFENMCLRDVLFPLRSYLRGEDTDSSPSVQQLAKFSDCETRCEVLCFVIGVKHELSAPWHSILTTGPGATKHARKLIKLCPLMVHRRCQLFHLLSERYVAKPPAESKIQCQDHRIRRFLPEVRYRWVNVVLWHI